MQKGAWKSCEIQDGSLEVAVVARFMAKFLE